MAVSSQSNTFSVLQDAYEFPEASYVPGFHVPALASSKVRVALAPVPATCTHSHAPTMSTHAFLSATPSLDPKYISPSHAAMWIPIQHHHKVTIQVIHSPTSQVHNSHMVRSTLESQSPPGAQLQQTQIIAVIIHLH